MTNARKNKILTLAYDLGYELERINDDDYDFILDEGGRPADIGHALDLLRLSMKNLKTV